MRKVIYGGACSLDGFLAGPGGDLDWLHFSKDVEAVVARSFANADTLLFGRKTWATAPAGGGDTATGDGAAAAGGEAGGSGSMRGVKSYVFSRTLSAVPTGVELVRRDAGEFVAELKTRPGKDMIVMSGGNLARSLFKAGVIDEVGLNIHPLLLGSGVPAFLDAGVRVNLELQECRTLDGGCVLVTYRVRR